MAQGPNQEAHGPSLLVTTAFSKVRSGLGRQRAGSPQQNPDQQILSGGSLATAHFTG